ncbi:MAG TPA: alpha/beta fold hydrolase, partial [Steroidobacteraceae bacterium]|nr:alpha/beta fold hydrolase [Steroidobacteraceae bacterium]
MLGGELAFAAALAALLAAALSLSIGAALAVAVALSMLLPGALMATSFLVAAFLAPGGRGGLRDTLRALLSEAIAFTVVVLTMALRRDRLPAVEAGNGVPAQPRGPRPLLLIHGIVCNDNIWRAWLKPLQTAGFGPVRALNLEPLFADIEIHATRVAQELRALQREADGARVAIVAHSMGGLVARAALRLLGPACVSRIVTIATPHHGTRVARCFPCLGSTRQMLPGSAWLQAINAAQEGRLAAP